MRLGFGCVNLGAARLGSANAQVRLVHEAIDAGVTLFDTADAYGHGSSERLLGRALRGHRSQVTVATKAGYLFDDRPRSIRVARTAASRVLAAVRPEPVRSGDCYAAQDFSPPVLRLAVDASLRRLGTDHIDVLQLHGPHEHLPHLFGELADLVAVGKVGRFGVGAESIAEAHEWLGTPGVEVLQVPFGLLDPVGATVLAGLHGIEGWVRGVFGGGVLTRAGATHGAAHPKEVVVEELRRTAASAGVDLFALAMGFVKAEPHIDTVLVGMSTPAHLRRNVELFDSMALDGETLRSVRDVLARHAAVLEAS